MLTGRALRPYAPVVTSFNGSTSDLTPASVTNLTPIEVVWKKRDRLKATISFADGPDETVEVGTEYCVRHGPPGFETVTVLGDDTDTSGTFNYALSGDNPTEIFARRDGYESAAFKFTTDALNAAGGSATGVMPAAVVVTGVSGGAVAINAAPIGSVAVSGPSGAATGGSPGSAAGLVGTVTVSSPAGSATVSGAGSASGLIGTVTVSAISGSAEGDAPGFDNALEINDAGDVLEVNDAGDVLDIGA